LLKDHSDAGKYDCLFWICYPKGGGKIRSDLKRDNIWNAFSIVNLRPVTQVAIDDTWSAMRGRPSELVGKWSISGYLCNIFITFVAWVNISLYLCGLIIILIYNE